MLTNFYTPEVEGDRAQVSQLGPMEDQLRQFLAQCNICPRQTAMFSATMPSSVERLARSALLNEIIVQIGEGTLGKRSEGELPVVPRSIAQYVVFLQTYQKKNALLDALRQTEAPPVLIFCDTIPNVEWVVALLRNEQFHVAGLHSDKSQGYRFRVIKAFKDGKLDVLVATDVASRGIDVVDITHVILYDMPDQIETYVHRIGRCGRAGRQGDATSFLTYHCKCAKELRKLLKKCKQKVPRELEDVRMFGHKVVQTELGDRVVFE